MNKLLLILLTALFLVSCKGEDVLIPVQLAEGDDYGYMNLDGIMVIPPQYSEAFAFRNGFALVVISDGSNKRYTFIDKKGNRMFGEFDKATAFDGGFTCVQVDGKTKYIDTKGNTIFENDEIFVEWFSEGMAGVRIKDKWGFINSRGEIVIQPQFDNVVTFADGMACVKVGDKWGFIDNKGKIVIEPKFEAPTWFRGGYAQIPDKGQYIDKQGNYVQAKEVHLKRNDFEGLILEDGKFRDEEGRLFLYEDDEKLDFPLPGNNYYNYESTELYYTGGYISFYLGYGDGVLAKIDHKNHCIKKYDVECDGHHRIQFHNGISVSYRLTEEIDMGWYTEVHYKQGIINKNLEVLLQPIYQQINLNKYDEWDD